jgi:hypothetical protein
MKTYWPLVATSLVAALVDSATAAVVSSRFSIGSKMMLNQTTLLAIGSSAQDFTPITANVGSAAYGSTSSTLESSDSLLRIASTMTPNSVYRGSSAGSGQYDLLAGTSVAVNWAWGHTNESGGWKVIDNASGSTVASLTFSQGQFTSIGGAFGTSASGNAVVSLSAAGSYSFEAFYFGKGTPTTSLVEFGFVVPAPGAVALAAAATAAATGSRRRRN